VKISILACFSAHENASYIAILPLVAAMYVLPQEAGCEKYFSDKITGSKFERKGLEELLAFVRPGDIVIVWKLDRLGRSLKDLIETLNLFKDRGVDFISLDVSSDDQLQGPLLRSSELTLIIYWMYRAEQRSSYIITEKIDTTTPGGKLIFHLMGALAEFERDLIRERTNAGLAAARARGRIGGRPRRLATNGKVALARRLFADPHHSIPEICSTLGISRSTLYRYVKTNSSAE
jgi:DNA invertase Pin-like site-specific DNA recombinase